MANPYRKRALRNLGSAGMSVAKSADKAAGNFGRWLVTDHTGLGDAFNRMPNMGFFDTVHYVVVHIIISLVGAVLTGLLAFIFIAYGIPLLFRL